MGKLPNGSLNIWCDLFKRIYSDAWRSSKEESCLARKKNADVQVAHSLDLFSSTEFYFKSRFLSPLGFFSLFLLLSYAFSHNIHKLVASMNKHAMVSSFLWWLIRFALKKREMPREEDTNFSDMKDLTWNLCRLHKFICSSPLSQTFFSVKFERAAKVVEAFTKHQSRCFALFCSSGFHFHPPPVGDYAKCLKRNTQKIC